jgi:hypothetical protein
MVWCLAIFGITAVSSTLFKVCAGMVLAIIALTACQYFVDAEQAAEAAVVEDIICQDGVEHCPDPCPVKSK